MNKMDSSKKITLGTILALSVYSSFGNPVIIPLFPRIMEYFQVTPQETTLLISMYALPGIAMIPLLGFLQDRIGRKPVLLCSLLVSVIGCVGISTAASFKTMLFWRMLLGLSVTPVEAMCNTLISDNFKGEDRLRYVSYCTSALFIGVASVPLISTAVMLSISWRAALLSPAVLGIPLILMALRMPMPYSSSSFELSSYLQNLRVVLLSRKMPLLFTIRAVSALVMFGTLHSYMPFLVTKKLGGSADMPGICMALFSIFLAFASLMLSLLLRNFGPVKTGIASGILTTLGLFGFAVVPSFSLVFIPLVLLGAGAGLMQSLNTAQVAQSVHANAKATVMSLYATLFRAAQAISPVIFSMFYSKGGFTMLYGAAGIIAIALTFICAYTFTLKNPVEQNS